MICKYFIRDSVVVPFMMMVMNAIDEVANRMKSLEDCVP